MTLTALMAWLIEEAVVGSESNKMVTNQLVGQAVNATSLASQCDHQVFRIKEMS